MNALFKAVGQIVIGVMVGNAMSDGVNKLVDGPVKKVVDKIKNKEES